MIYTFWEGQKPAYIELCMETWKFPFVLLNYDNLNEYTDLPVEQLKRFTLPQIADCVRVHVLRDQGGYWLDADTIMVGEQLPDVMILGDNETRANTIGYLHTEPQTDMFVKWADFQDEIISSSGPSGDWALMGNRFTDPYLREHTEIQIGSIYDYWPETENIHDRIRKYTEFYFEQSYHLSDINHAGMIMLHNSWTPDWYKTLPKEGVLSHSCTLSNILKFVKKH